MGLIPKFLKSSRNGKPKRKRRPRRRRNMPLTRAELDAQRIHELELQVQALEAEKRALERTRDFAFKEVELAHRRLEQEQAMTDRKTAEQIQPRPRRARP